MDKDHTGSINVSGRRSDIECTPCRLSEPKSRKPAEGYCQNCQEYLCRSCFDSHTKPAPCRDHVLLDKDHMSLPIRRPSITSTSSNDSVINHCLRHNNHPLEYYCEDHSQNVCSQCIQTTHNHCKYKRMANEATSPLASDDKLQRTLNKVDIVRRMSQMDIKMIKDLVTEVKQTETDIGNEVLKLREEINKRLDIMEETIKSKASKIVGAEIKRVSDFNTQLNGIVEELGKIDKSLIDHQKEDKDSQSLNIIEEAEEQLNDLLKQEANINRHSVANIVTFTPNTNILDQLDSMEAKNQYGIFNTELRTVPGAALAERIDIIKSMEGSNLKHKMLVLNKAGHIDIADERKSKKEGVHEITGLVTIASDACIAADRTNKCLIYICLRRNKVTQNQEMPNKPWGITGLPCNEVAVTIPNNNIIQIVSIADGVMTLTRAFDTGKYKCYGICYSETMIYTTIHKPPKVLVFSENGAMLRQVCDGLFLEPNYIVPNRDGKCLYVTDYERNSVTKVTVQGEKRHDYMLGEPIDSGLTVISDGTVLICCKEGRKLVRLSRNLQLLPLDHLSDSLCRKPQVVSYCDKTRRVFVGGIDNRIVIYNVEWM